MRQFYLRRSDAASGYSFDALEIAAPHRAGWISLNVRAFSAIISIFAPPLNAKSIIGKPSKEPFDVGRRPFVQWNWRYFGPIWYRSPIPTSMALNDIGNLLLGHAVLAKCFLQVFGHLDRTTQGEPDHFHGPDSDKCNVR
jgi:hypothetical protein